MKISFESRIFVLKLMAQPKLVDTREYFLHNSHRRGISKCLN
jgi:hypothetical protein